MNYINIMLKRYHLMFSKQGHVDGNSIGKAVALQT